MNAITYRIIHLGEHDFGECGGVMPAATFRAEGHELTIGHPEMNAVMADAMRVCLDTAAIHGYESGLADARFEATHTNVVYDENGRPAGGTPKEDK